MSSSFLIIAAKTVPVTLLCAATGLLLPPSAMATEVPQSGGANLCFAGFGGFAFGSTQAPLEAAARSALIGVAGVDGAYVQIEDDGTEGGVTINVLAREHGLVNREDLFKIEEDLEKAFGMPVTFVVRAHQGRDLRSMAGPSLLFARG